MSIIHIIQTDRDSRNTETIITDTQSIAEMNFVHPTINTPNEGEESSATPFPGHDIDKAEQQTGEPTTIEILYVNGERRNITTAVPTVFRMADEDNLIVQTASARKFEKAYLGDLAEAFAADEEGD